MAALIFGPKFGVVHICVTVADVCCSVWVELFQDVWCYESYQTYSLTGMEAHYSLQLHSGYYSLQLHPRYLALAHFLRNNFLPPQPKVCLEETLQPSIVQHVYLQTKHQPCH